MIKRILLEVLGGSLILFFCVVAESQAQAVPHLVISEVQITGGVGKSNNDFVEIYNPTDTIIDIGGWQLKKRIKSGTESSIKVFAQDKEISAHSYFLWANTTDSFHQTIGADESSGAILSNDYSIALFNNEGVLIDALAWGSGHTNPFIEGSAFLENPLANQSIERHPGGAEGNGTDTDNNVSDFFVQTNPNPQNSGIGGSIPDDPEIELPDIQAGEMVINEIVPNPSDGAEWVEFYNNTTSAINLTGCKIYDGTGNAVLSLSGSVAGQGFFVAELFSARLNNTGDLVVLKNARDVVIDQVAYGSWDDGQIADNAPNPSAGQSVARKSNGVDTNHDNNDFAVSDQTTPWLSNVIHTTTVQNQGGTNVSANLGTVPLPKIVINEFVVGSEKEAGWVELYLGGEVSMDLEGWYLENGAENKTSLSGVLIPGQFKVIEKINGALNSKGDIIRLKNKDEQVYDSVSYGAWEDGKPSDNAPVAQSPFSVARIKDGVDTNNDKKDFSVTSVVTKGRANKIEKVIVAEDEIKNNPTQPPLNFPPKADPPWEERGGERGDYDDLIGKLLINEVLPNPAGSDDAEWVELFWGGAESLDLTGFSIDDKKGGSKPFTIGSSASVVVEAELPVIKPGEYVVLKREITKLAFNNDTDEVRLFDKNGEIVDEVEYEEGAEGLAYARGADGVWGWTDQLTPERQNVLEIKNDALASSRTERSGVEGSHAVRHTNLAGVRDLETGANAQTKGVVAVLPGVLGAQVFYIIDGVSGLQVYSNKKAFPKLELGDLVQITGILSQAQGEARIKTKIADDILVFSKGSVPTVREFTGEEIGEDQEGSLIKIQGTIIDKISSGFVVDAGFGEVSVAIKKTAGINAREIIPGLQVVITGIVGNSTAGYRVMPRNQEDIEVIGMDELAAGISSTEDSSKENTPYGKATAYAGGGAALVAMGIRRRKLFVNGARAVLFLMGKGNGQGKDLI